MSSLPVGETLTSQPAVYSGNIDVSGEASLHQGDNNTGVHHHYYGVSNPLKSNFDRQKYDELLDSLTFERMDSRLRNVTTALPNTCTWIFHHQSFVAWSDDSKYSHHNGFLCIKGKPGCGKSTIMKTTMNWTRKNWPKEWIIVSYFFNARAPSNLEKSSLGLYQSVTHQLLSAFSGFEQSFLKSFSSKIRNDSAEEWSISELQEFLVEIAQSTQRPPLCLFADALDEGEEDDVRSMVDFLEEVSSQAASSRQSFRICLSSRHYPNITFSQALYLTIEDELEHGRDVEIYIDRKLKAVGHQGMSDLRGQLIRKSEKIFLYVVLVVPLLNKAYDRGGGLKAMSMLLKDIPKGLSGLFSDILSKHTDCFDECVILLRWFLFSARPLNPQELYLATLYTKYTDLDTDFQEEEEAVFDMDRLQRCILDWSRGLVEVTKTEHALEDTFTVQFIHETVRDHLLFSQEASQIIPALSSNFQGESHEIMKNACVRYLASKQNQLERVKACLGRAVHMENAREKCPFMTYSMYYSLWHADKAQQHGVSQGAFLLSQTQRGKAGPVDWYAIFNPAAYLHCDNMLLRLIADNNLQYLAQVLVRESVDLRLVDPQSKRAALRVACELGYVEVARCLIECGVYDSSVRGTGTDGIFRRACRVGHLEIVKLLADRGVDVNARGGHALEAACTGGHVAVAKLLLDRGADVNARGGSHGSALCAACFKGHLEIVELLLDRQADINVVAEGHETGLIAAASEYHLPRNRERVVRLLIDRGADVRARTSTGMTVLCKAAQSGLSRIVQILLDVGAGDLPDKSCDEVEVRHALKSAWTGLATGGFSGGFASDGRRWSGIREGLHETIRMLEQKLGRERDTKWDDYDEFEHGDGEIGYDDEECEYD